MIEEEARERRARELRALVRVEDRRTPCFAMASSTAAIQNALSSVIETRQLSTRRLAQSRTAAKYTKPCAIGM